jgi:predicted phosphodiesterase
MRVLVISDIHSNSIALAAVLGDAGPVDATWCLGDVVGYGPAPNECIGLLAERAPDLLCITGNHDRGVLGRLDLSGFHPDAEAAARWTAERLTPETHSFLERLPETLVSGDFTLVHGTPRQPVWEYMMSAQIAAANFPLFSTPFCLIGHTHLPGYIADEPPQPPLMAGPPPLPLALGDTRLFINPGSVGQPRDYDPRASYAVIDMEARTCTFCRVEYDIAETQRLMRKAGLPPRLINRLSFGR